MQKLSPFRTCLKRLGRLTTAAMASSSSSQHYFLNNNNNNNNETTVPTITVGNQSFSSSSPSSPPTVVTTNPWCRIAQIDDPISGVVSLMEPPSSSQQLLLQDQNNNSNNNNNNSNNLDLTISTEWMEYIERIENRTSDEGGGAGAYDTLRCDVIISSSSSTSSSSPSCADTNLRVWGEEFHLQRLQQSYLSLLHSEKGEQQKQKLLSASTTTSINIAMEHSRSILHALLKEAQELSSSTTTANQMFTNNDNSKTFIHLFRVTLLWSPPYPSLSSKNTPTYDDSATLDNDDDDDDDDDGKNMTPIIVRGHASCNFKPMEINLNPKSIIASVAVHSHHHHSRTTTTTNIDKNLPTRHDNPQSKVASWCRLRKKMENPATYKPAGVSEVLMVRKRKVVGDDSNETTTATTTTTTTTTTPLQSYQLEVLEGLSSNFFVVYMDGSLRTASDGVLFGYVRNLVLECAPKAGLTYDPTKPILLSETNQWREAFITSSSRLIYPISSIIIPDDYDDGDDQHDINDTNITHHSKHFREIWHDKVLKNKEFDNTTSSSGDESFPLHPERTTTTTQKWQQLLREVLKTGGYDVSK